MARPAVRALVYCSHEPLYLHPVCFLPDPDSACTRSATPDQSSAYSLYLVCPLATDPARLTMFGFVVRICVSFWFGLLHCVYVCVALINYIVLHAIPE
ncbi:unnamed protein product, partial [Staurois parvus]